MKFDPKAIPGELITYHSTDGIGLQGFLVKSKRRTGKVIVNIHGLTGSFFKSATQKRILPHYRSAGYDFFMINTRGHGLISPMHRLTGKKSKWVNIGTTFERFEDCIHDLKGVVNFLHSRGYRNIILQGHSSGCQKATYYMYKTRDKRVSALVLLAPCDDYSVAKNELGRKFKPALRVARKMARKSNLFMPKEFTGNEFIITGNRFLSLYDPSSAEARIFDYGSGMLREFRGLKLPVMAVFGTKEENRTKDVRVYLQQLEKATRSEEFLAVEVPGANHAFKNREAETAQAVVDWLDKVV